MGWFSQFDRSQRTAFWACFAGWALDAMDLQIYALVMPAIMAAWTLTKADAGLLGTVALLASSVGGAIAGRLADRYGRVRILQFSILWFSAFTFLSGFAQNYDQLLVTRTLQGLGFGGEWSAGSVLIAELVAPAVRGRAVAAVSSGWSVGYALAAVLFGVVFHFFPAATAWRVMFLLGVAPSLLIVHIRRQVPESSVYVAAQDMLDPPTRMVDIFGGGHGRNTVLGFVISLGVLGGNYTVLSWLPTYLSQERHLSTYSTTGYLLINILGSFLGYILGGEISDRIGRRAAFRLFAVLGVASAVSYVLLSASPVQIAILGFPLGFAQSGLNAGLGPLLSELFPTRLRATGQGFCYNAGRGVGALLPALVGIMSVSLGVGPAICAMASLAYAIVIVVSFALADTNGVDLLRVDAENNAPEERAPGVLHGRAQALEAGRGH